MTDYIAVLNTNAGLISAVATVAIAVLTAILWCENRSLRKAGNSPEVVAYLSMHEDGNGAVNFVLANIGTGPAFNVSFELMYNEDDFLAHHALLMNAPERTAASVLPQDEKMRALLGISFELYGKIEGNDIGPLKPFKVNIRYKNISGRILERTDEIDITQFAGLRGIFEKSHARRTSDAMEKIEKHMEKLARASSRYSAFVDVTDISDDFVKKAKGSPQKDQET